MATAPPKPRQVAQHGITFEPLIPGAFYQGIMPGGFSDSLTGLHIPGPKAIIDGPLRRETIALTDLPDPIQIPHTKIVIDLNESGKSRKEIEVPFNEHDETPLHDAFQLALGTGIIRMVPDDVVEEKYPGAWAKRIEHYVWQTDKAKQQRPAMEMIQEAEDAGRFLKLVDAAGAERETQAERQRQIDAPRTTTKAPPRAQ